MTTNTQKPDIGISDTEHTSLVSVSVSQVDAK